MDLLPTELIIDILISCGHTNVKYFSKSNKRIYYIYKNYKVFIDNEIHKQILYGPQPQPYIPLRFWFNRNPGLSLFVVTTFLKS